LTDEHVSQVGNISLLRESGKIFAKGMDNLREISFRIMKRACSRSLGMGGRVLEVSSLE
jgi:hypothetical protein